MFGHDFYFSLIRKYVITFGTIFNDINISREDAEGVQTSYMRVPLSYAPKEKMLARVIGDPAIDRPTATTLPRMSFEMGTLSYDGDRKLNTLGSVHFMSTDTSKVRRIYNPVPYNIQFKLYIFVKNAEDGTKIVEQILPFFTPDWTPTVKLIPEMGVVLDIPIVLNSISQEDTYTDKFAERRSLIWTLNFTLKGYLYGPVKEKKVIKFANTTVYSASTTDLVNAIGNTAPTVRVTVQPGLTANGEPTSNAALTIPYSEIEADDDFGYVINITEDFE